VAARRDVCLQVPPIDVESIRVTTSLGLFRRPRAGRRAEERYRELRRAWRRRVLWRFRLVVWPLLVLSLVGGALLPGIWRWFAGFLGGACYSFWLYARDAVPVHIERWMDGAQGEKWTEKRLRPLERDGWIVAHDLEAKFGNVDHFIVGPGGVFLLDSKNWSGIVSIEDGIATVTPPDNPDAAWSWPRLPGALKRASFKNKEAIEKLTGVRVFVQPVVVIWAPFEQRQVLSNGVVYVAGDFLETWLRSLPLRLDNARSAQIGRLLAS
jgi:hypothetical protein